MKLKCEKDANTSGHGLVKKKRFQRWLFCCLYEICGYKIILSNECLYLHGKYDELSIRLGNQKRTLYIGIWNCCKRGYEVKQMNVSLYKDIKRTSG